VARGDGEAGVVMAVSSGAASQAPLVKSVIDHIRTWVLPEERVGTYPCMRNRAYSELHQASPAVASNAMTPSERTQMDPVFNAVARYFALMSDTTRLRILHAVCHGERSVSEIVELTGGSQTNISRNLNLMHERGALERRKEGAQVYYRVADQALVELCRNVCQRVSASARRDEVLREGLSQVADGFS
jgi:DNA-binding transcriptional ArsR family regulator